MNADDEELQRQKEVWRKDTDALKERKAEHSKKEKDDIVRYGTPAERADVELERHKEQVAKKTEGHNTRVEETLAKGREEIQQLEKRQMTDEQKEAMTKSIDQDFKALDEKVAQKQSNSQKNEAVEQQEVIRHKPKQGM